ncbi:OmpH family outer membrane protein [Alkalilimnicola ehrlichii]|uniref:Outer membrane chaperone Skp (OmpH) n=2 Tax=Alkalilimnicola ehrlichii TaxID=351052 RepID=A0A3E0WPH5_9GAMM|nr:OmpH family outer membrane protein [Alkalilimnicola ehrlichii]RFA34852.1 hypothetical protein CAL65_14225 [Alkalilimnicola ehrlichii]
MTLGAAGAAAAESLKIGFVNAARVSSEAPQAEEARRKLESEFAGRDQELVAMQREARQLEERLARDADVMSESEQRELERQLVSRQREIRRVQDEFREDFSMRRNEELGKLQRRIVEAIHELAKEEGFDLIVSDGVIFASDQVDITNKVIERLGTGESGSRR